MVSTSARGPRGVSLSAAPTLFLEVIDDNDRDYLCVSWLLRVALLSEVAFSSSQ